MLKFSTISLCRIDSKQGNRMEVRPLIVPPQMCELNGAILKGRNAFIVGKALKLAGFFLPCFYEGDMKELDNPHGNVIMVLPSGEYLINVTLDHELNYLLDLA